MDIAALQNSTLMIVHLLFLLLFCSIDAHKAEKSYTLRMKEPISKPSEQLCSGDEPTLQLRPLIGILSQPGDGDKGRLIKRMGWNSTNVSYIAASYVKFIEMGGARAVPLIYNEPFDTLLLKFAAINGILFPGGSASLRDGLFYRTAEKLFKMALEENDKGDYFPVFGTCLGFELLCIIVSQDHDVLQRFSAQGQPSTLLFKNDWSKQRNMFKEFPSRLIEKVSTESLAMENHQFGISPENFTTNEALSSFFRVLTTSLDKNHKVYVSTVEGRNYPVTGVQWHPEKNAFEWGLSSIPHSAEAIHVCQSVANFLVSELRKSNHTRSLEDEKKFLIYNYSPYYTGKDGHSSFEQSYVFVQ
ncbi:hypothetical protein GOP47_0006142 [Adiantum capillus-veneris]|uniref:folate gamma-glutamyl hydrolase n=1 Tax=Adiantum capillus-veneris TaxID=13818 RepID=A0A9D4V307_ADICA|nr:hypothetical protein GOP47_0006142 [Adiantum capillus-veneris]